MRIPGIDAGLGGRGAGAVAGRGHGIGALLAVAIAFWLTPGIATAAAVVDGEFDLSGQPGKLTLGSDGNVWVLIQGATNEIARVAPDGAVTEFDSDDLVGAIGIATGPDGNLWFTKLNAVLRVNPANPTVVESFAVAAIAGARGITSGPDGNLWTASGDRVIRIPPENPAGFAEFTVAGLDARGTSSGGGLIWVADFGGARVVSVTTDGGTITPYDVGAGTGPQEVAGGPGAQVAYTNPGAMPDEVGLISQGGAAQPVPSGADPFGITFGPDGAFWIAQFASDELGRLSTDGQFTSLAGLSAGAGAREIAAGAGNTLWVSLETAEKIARVSGVEPPPAPPPNGGGGGGGTTCAAATVLGARAFKPRAPRAARQRIRGVGLRLRLNRPAVIRLQSARVIYRQAGKRRSAPLGAAVLNRRSIAVSRRPALRLRLRARHPAVGTAVKLRLRIRARPRQAGCPFGRVRQLTVNARVGPIARRGAL